MNQATDLFIQVPETVLPGGEVVPGFQVGQFACSKSSDGRAIVTDDGKPWVNINYHNAKAACEAAGYKMITEKQWLAIAHNAAAQDCNWTKGKVGEGKLFRGIRKGLVSSAQAGDFESSDPKERRWLTLSNGERICDLNGNVFQWVFDDVQGNEKGLPSVIAADSLSLQAPYPSEQKGMGWYPEFDEDDEEIDWSGCALVRGGCFSSGGLAGAFRLLSDWPGNGYYRVGFRCTK